MSVAQSAKVIWGVKCILGVVDAAGCLSAVCWDDAASCTASSIAASNSNRVGESLPSKFGTGGSAEGKGNTVIACGYHKKLGWVVAMRLSAVINCGMRAAFIPAL